jgi:hypothetical protein
MPDLSNMNDACWPLFCYIVIRGTGISANFNWGRIYVVALEFEMHSLQHHIATMSKLIKQLQKLSQLRDRVKRETLSARRRRQVGRRKRSRA